MRYRDLIENLQREMNAQGASLEVDGVPGSKTQAALLSFDVGLVVSRIPVAQTPPPVSSSGKTPFEWVQGELGQKEILGSKDNPRIRWYYTSCANIGSREYHDEVPWCSAILNKAADECGFEKTDNALAVSWKAYGTDSGDEVEAGDIVTIGSSHVTLANKPFNRRTQKTFEGLGGNQGNQVKVSIYECSRISSVRKWKAKGQVFAPLPRPYAKITTGSDPDEGTEEWYIKMFAVCAVLPEKAAMLASTLAKIQKGMPRYLEVAKRLGAANQVNFACILGAIHWKEASCDFKGVLHNGEKIVGTKKKTKLVPKGRGPFPTWEDSAVDAIAIESSRWRKLLAVGGDIGDVLWSLERFNGTGYISGAGRSETSPYLWSCSNVNDGKGKYVSDGKFDPNASTGATVGAALILKELSNQGLFKVNS